MTSVLRRSTLIPVAAMLILVKRPICSSTYLSFNDGRSFFDCGFNLIEFEALKLSEQTVLHLNFRDVHRLFLCIDVVAVRFCRCGVVGDTARLNVTPVAGLFALEMAAVSGSKMKRIIIIVARFVRTFQFALKID